MRSRYAAERQESKGMDEQKLYQVSVVLDPSMLHVLYGCYKAPGLGQIFHDVKHSETVCASHSFCRLCSICYIMNHSLHQISEQN